MCGKQLLWPTLRYSVFLGGLQKSSKKTRNKNSHHRSIASRIRTGTPNDYNTALDPIYGVIQKDGLDFAKLASSSNE
jgi:hypothetical protein